jgi:hypothetical protein
MIIISISIQGFLHKTKIMKNHAIAGKNCLIAGSEFPWRHKKALLKKEKR